MNHTAALLVQTFDAASIPVAAGNDNNVSLNRRDVTDGEVLRTLNRIKRSKLGTTALALAAEIFDGKVRKSGTTYLRHAEIVAEGGVRLALRDNCLYPECLQQFILNLFHDAEEDVPGSLSKIEKLTALGMDPDTIQDIRDLTRLLDDKYYDRIDIVLDNSRGTGRRKIRAKKPDSEHNFSGSEQVIFVATGEQKKSQKRYAICLPMYDAFLEGRCDPNKGVKGYLKTIGQDTLIQENRDVFKGGFVDPDDILAIIDTKAPLVRKISIHVPNWHALAASMKEAFQKLGHQLAPNLVGQPDQLPPMDVSRTLTKTTHEHPERRSI